MARQSAMVIRKEMTLDIKNNWKIHFACSLFLQNILDVVQSQMSGHYDHGIAGLE